MHCYIVEKRTRLKVGSGCCLVSLARRASLPGKYSTVSDAQPGSQDFTAAARSTRDSRMPKLKLEKKLALWFGEENTTNKRIMDLGSRLTGERSRRESRLLWLRSASAIFFLVLDVLCFRARSDSPMTHGEPLHSATLNPPPAKK